MKKCKVCGKLIAEFRKNKNGVMVPYELVKEPDGKGFKYIMQPHYLTCEGKKRK